MKITARLLSGEVCHVEIDGHVFKDVTATKEDILDLPWIAPGLVDIQVNGFGGIDFNRAITSDDAWHHATQQLYAHGCTGFLLTLITNTDAGYRELLTGLTGRIDLDPRNCLGFHMEGPWLNPDPGCRGAHRAEWMRKPELKTLEEWWGITGPLLKLVTLAPEVGFLQAAFGVPGGRDFAEMQRTLAFGREKEIHFFIGHSAATGDYLNFATGILGATGWTHLGNAVPAQVPKFDNVIMHVLGKPDLYASLIPDGLHVPEYAFRVMAHSLQRRHPPRLLLTTDAMAAAGAGKAGRYTLGEVEVEVGDDGAARLPESGRLAGSTLTPFEGVFRAERMSGMFLEDVWNAFSTRPASLLGLTHGIAAGNPADFCLISPEKTPRLLETYHRGACVYEAP
jgi:N-acetylglucosamine-6-phosphate deacetylase